MGTNKKRIYIADVTIYRLQPSDDQPIEDGQNKTSHRLFSKSRLDGERWGRGEIAMPSATVWRYGGMGGEMGGDGERWGRGRDGEIVKIIRMF